jgi:hypothetical protein
MTGTHCEQVGRKIKDKRLKTEAAMSSSFLTFCKQSDKQAASASNATQ